MEDFAGGRSLGGSEMPGLSASQIADQRVAAGGLRWEYSRLRPPPPEGKRQVRVPHLASNPWRAVLVTPDREGFVW